MLLSIRKLIVKIRMAYADGRGHHGKKWNYEPGDYYHNIIIGRLFDDAREQAWLNIRQEDIVIDLMQEEDFKTLDRRNKTNETANILNMYK